MRVDLHTHSHVSDGTQTPADLLAAAATAGLDVLALTDHDTTAGWDEAAAAVGPTGVALVRGSEISCTAGGISVHLLSYLHDPDHPGLAAELTASRESRDGRARHMVELISRDLDLTWEDVQEQAGPGATIGRPHIADALVARGHVADRTAAFGSVLSAASPYYVRYRAPDAVTAVRLVREAGGVPVIAHARAAARGRVIGTAVLRAMVAAGMAGIEVDHRDHDDRDKEILRELAAELGVLVTGSSDYHGAGKPNRLGEHLTSPEVLEQIEAQGALPVLRP